MKPNYFLLLIMLIGIFSCDNKNQLTIIENNTTKYEIVLPNNSDKIVEKAASELQFYFEKISSVKIPIVKQNNLGPNKKNIFVGIKEDSLNSSHSILIKNEGDNIVIIASLSASCAKANENKEITQNTSTNTLLILDQAASSLS